MASMTGTLTQRERESENEKVRMAVEVVERERERESEVNLSGERWPQYKQRERGSRFDFSVTLCPRKEKGTGDNEKEERVGHILLSLV